MSASSAIIKMTAFNPAKLMREVRQEVSRVVWPTRKETMISVVLVMLLVSVVSVFLIIVDNLAQYGVQWVLGFGK
jgi:preprotein translocase subunit SecE